MLMCYAFTPDSVFKWVPPNGSEPTWKTSMLYSDIAPLIYVNETMCMVICPSTRFKSIILWPRMNHLVPRLSQNASYGLGAGGEGDDRGWDGWMASLTRWTWVSVNSGSWWWTGRPGMLWFMGSQRVRHDWVNDLIWYMNGLMVFPTFFNLCLNLAIRSPWSEHPVSFWLTV